MTETAVETYETTTRGAASMAAYRAVRILQLLSENTGEDKAMLSDELIRRLAHPDDPARMPISAARRSIYTAISALRHAGYEIEYKRGVGYRLLTRPLTDEEIIRLHGMVMRNRSTPIAIRKSMAQHLVDIQVDRGMVLHLHRVGQAQAGEITRQLLGGFGKQRQV